MEIWKPPVELSQTEQVIVQSCKKRRVYVFLRELRHRIFDEAMQEKLMAAYSAVERGKTRVPPAQLGLAVLLQAALGAPDRARYRGLRRNLFDLRRHAALNNLKVVDQLRRAA
jgi:hypothetical protein